MNEGLLLAKKVIENIASRFRWQNIFSNCEEDSFSKVNQDLDCKSKCDDSECSGFIENSKHTIECAPKEELYFQLGNLYESIALNDGIKYPKEYCARNKKNENLLVESIKCKTDIAPLEKKPLFFNCQFQNSSNESELCDKMSLPHDTYDTFLLKFAYALHNCQTVSNENIFSFTNYKVFKESKSAENETSISLFSYNKNADVCSYDEFDFFLESLKDVVFLRKTEMHDVNSQKMLIEECDMNAADDIIQSLAGNNFNSENQAADLSKSNVGFSSTLCSMNSSFKNVNASASIISMNDSHFRKTFVENFLRLSQLPSFKLSMLSPTFNINNHSLQCDKFKEVTNEPFSKTNIQKCYPRNIRKNKQLKNMHPISNLDVIPNCLNKIQSTETSFNTSRSLFFTNSQNNLSEMDASSSIAPEPMKIKTSLESIHCKKVHQENDLRVKNSHSIGENTWSDLEVKEHFKNLNEINDFDIDVAANIEIPFESMIENYDSDKDVNMHCTSLHFDKHSENEYSNALDSRYLENNNSGNRPNSSIYALSRSKKCQAILVPNQIAEENNFNLHDCKYGKHINGVSSLENINLHIEKLKSPENILSDNVGDTVKRSSEEFSDFLPNAKKKYLRNISEEANDSISSYCEFFTNDEPLEKALFHTAKMKTVANYSLSEQLSSFYEHKVNKKGRKASNINKNLKEMSKNFESKSLMMSKLNKKANDKTKHAISKSATKATDKCVPRRQAKKCASYTESKKNRTIVSNSSVTRSDVFYSCNVNSCFKQQQVISSTYETHIVEKMDYNCSQKDRNSISDVLNTVTYNKCISGRKKKYYSKEMKYAVENKSEFDEYSLTVINSLPSSKTIDRPAKIPLQLSPIYEGAMLDDLLPKSKYKKYKNVLSSIEYPKLSSYSVKAKKKKQWKF